MRTRNFATISFFLFFILSLISFFSPAFAQTAEEKNFLLLYFKEEELIVESPTRSPKPVSKVAENVTVVTAADIELMNAHTLADVLNTVTGVQVFMTGGPGQVALGQIQGSEERHVAVFIDGVSLTNLAANNVELGVIPVQMIEKIEIIKGPASSAWGSALGGVVNVITKAGKSNNQGEMLSADYGTWNSGDFRAEARGKQDGFGYYVTAGRLQSKGLTLRMGLAENNAYTKLTYDLSDRTTAFLTFGYEKNIRETGKFPDFNLTQDNSWEAMHASLGINSALGKDLELNISARAIRQDYINDVNELSSGLLIDREHDFDHGYGASAKLTYKSTFQTIVLGSDYDNKWLKSNIIADGQQGIEKWAVYLNDTLSFNKLSITPGVRYEKTNTNGEATAPSLGITYSITNDTIFRAYTAEGYNIPSLGERFGNNIQAIANPNLKVEKVTSYQSGVETAALKYLWVKVSVFDNEIRDAIATEPTSTLTFTTINKGRQRRQGAELEVKTAPVYHFSVSTGAEFIDAKDLETGQRLLDVPTRVYDLGLRYDDEHAFKALLQGRYIDWNADQAPSQLPGSYGSFVFDLTMILNIYKRKDVSLEAFVDGHNIFNGSQYIFSVYKNPERWYEGGIRYKF